MKYTTHYSSIIRYFWKIRAYLESKASEPESKYRGFPLQQCWNASTILGTILLNRFSELHVNWTLGSLNGFLGHSWIEFYELRLDLTGDQFGVPRTKLISNKCSQKKTLNCKYDLILTGSFADLQIDPYEVEGFMDLQTLYS